MNPILPVVNDPYYPALQLSFAPPPSEKESKEAYYGMVLQGEARACGIRHLQQVYANRELLLWQKGQLLEDAFAWPWLKEHLYGNRKAQFKFQVKNMLRPTLQVADPVLWCLDGYATGGYFHWIVDILPRLWMGRHYLPEARFAIPDYFLSRWSFVAEYLELLGVTQLQVLTPKSKYLFRQLVLPTRAGNPFFLQPGPLQQGVEWLRSAALKKSSCNLGKRLFISRSRAAYRKITNEQSLMPVLERHGFQWLCLEDYPLADQISICQHADTILGLHGAGLANLVFMQPKSKVIEIRPDKVYNMYTCFFTLCPHFDIDYHYILCNYAPEKLATEKRIDDHSVVLAPALLDEALTKICS